jgi:hypothetical protein
MEPLPAKKALKHLAGLSIVPFAFSGEAVCHSFAVRCLFVAFLAMQKVTFQEMK